ncbi:hypothetical protein [Agrobacterium deltaense]|uniref:hypothetical protein n=1 Tax=Agrobacterium deltaense TaxID=1183412 RepID=UPI000F64117A|nr:hypothetical protein [Agrobacterium deltaense]RRN75990.1 hypothetical protein EIQ31_02610 [Agrobacterium deltaense]
MELKNFIRETLVNIATGIQEAKLETSDFWAINPGSLNGERVIERSYIDFDVAITVSESVENQKEGKGGVKAEISVLGSKISGDVGRSLGTAVQQASENVSRVSFKVPVYMNAHYRGDENIKQEAEYFDTRTGGHIEAR